MRLGLVECVSEELVGGEVGEFDVSVRGEEEVGSLGVRVRSYI